jgi:hypothetical protein
VLADRDRLLEQARDEAERLVQAGREEQGRLVEATAVYTRAQAEADRMLDQAHAEAEAMRLQTEDYVDAKLANFENVLSTTLATVQRGRERLSGRPVTTSCAASTSTSRRPPAAEPVALRPRPTARPLRLRRLDPESPTVPENRKPQHRLDPRQPLVLDTRELGRRPGSMRTLQADGPGAGGPRGRADRRARRS